MQNLKSGRRSSNHAQLWAAGTFWAGMMVSGCMLAAVIFLSS